ncbi:MAG TPA: hypothetical protein VKG05_09970 [Steroidobacteraceae bacterium]|nr:hypothetical protein [Steroidobacteraceae bacterium]
MKLPDFLKDPDLNELRRRMGADELGAFRLSANPYRFTMAELERLIDAGIDLNSLDELRPLPDRTLAYKDRRVLLYRRDLPMLGLKRALKVELPHFHLSNCGIVRRLRAAESASRHAVSAREDGSFQINLVHGPDVRPSFEQLPVCEDCLAELDFDGYSSSGSGSGSSAGRGAARVRALEGFTIRRFFETYTRALSADSNLG